jgi:hypothetical protein
MTHGEIPNDQGKQRVFGPPLLLVIGAWDLIGSSALGHWDFRARRLSLPAMPRARLPLWVKILYTAFVAFMLPIYWRSWGPQNFLYFCDIALLVTLVGIWLENALLISMQAIAILLPQVYWIIDFTAHLLGFHVLRMTDYMFNTHSPLLVRGISLFHGWLPIVLVWLVYRVGYDRRALRYQTIAGTMLLLICYFGFAPPGSHGSGKVVADLNFVFGPSTSAQETFMPPLAWLAIVIVGLPILIYWPTHCFLKRAMPKRAHDAA